MISSSIVKCSFRDKPLRQERLVALVLRASAGHCLRGQWVQRQALHLPGHWGIFRMAWGCYRGLR